MIMITLLSISILTVVFIFIIVILSIFEIYFILLHSFNKIKCLIKSNFSRDWTEGFDEPIINRFPSEEERYSPYPQQYSLILDFILPCILLIISFWPVFLNASLTVIISFFAINYLLLLVPFIIFWAKLRNWEPLEIIHTFSNPMWLKYTITGIVYPSFYILFIGLLRYLSMGSEYIPNLNFFSLNNVIYMLFLFSHIFLGLFSLAKIYTKLRLFFLKEFKLCFHSLHVYFLRNKKYWKFCQNISKYSFACNHLFSVNSHLNGPWKKKYPFIMKFLGYIWYTNPKITFMLIPIFFILEFSLKGKIYYWFYFLFAFFCIRGLLIIFRNLTHDTDNIYFNRYFTGDCNLSNAYNEKSWYTPYYPKFFAFHMEFDFTEKYVSPEKLQRINQIAQATPDLPLTNYYERTRKHLSDVLQASKLPMFRQIKLYYRYSEGTKWIHTFSYKKKYFSTVISKRNVNTVSSTSKAYHPMLPHLLQDIFSRLTMVTEAHNWRALYPKIQQAEKLYPSPHLTKDLYSSEVSPELLQYKPTATNIVNQTEFNTLTVFSSWVAKGVEVGPHKPSNLYTNSLSQSNPDVSFKMETMLHKKQPVLIGMDLKAIRVGRIGTGSNYIVGISKEKYKIILASFLREHKNSLSGEAEQFILNLGAIDDVEERLFFYRENMHHFINLGKFPPINIEKMVFERFFSSEYKIISFAHKIKMELLSDYIWKKEPLKGDSLRKQTLNLLNDTNVMSIKKDISDMLP